MKSITKQVELSKNQKKINNHIIQIEADQSQFKQDAKLSNKKFSMSNKKPGRQSENIKKISMAYGGTVPHKQPKKSFSKKIQDRKNDTQFFKTFSSQVQQIVQGTSTINSLEGIKFQKLCTDPAVDNKTQNSDDAIIIQHKFCPIEPKQIKIQNKRNASSPPSKIQQNIFQKSKHVQTDKKSATIPKVQNIDATKQKAKKIYDMIRSPQHKNNTTKTAQTDNEVSPKKNSRHQIQNQTQYIAKITGKSKRKIEELRTDKVSTQQYLTGKVSIIWIFAIKSPLPKQIQERIHQMYNPLLDDDRAVPFVTNPKRIQQFVNIPNCYFKIVTDLQSAQKAIGFRIYTKVIQFYIWNEKGNETLIQALQYKSATRKVKGIFTQWDKILNRAQQQIQEQIAIYKVNNGLQKRQRQRKFPNFLKLTDTDKTDATLYRINLYGAIKLLQQQKKQNYDNFMRLVLNKYENNQDQQKNIQDYMKIDHLKFTNNLQQARQIIQFYVRESFYYQTLNSMLRTMKTSEQFKPCNLPFNETYLSIRLYYQNYLKQTNQQIPQMTLYRGCKLSKKDFNQLKPGTFIEMFGFMSTSKKQERALDFVDRDGYLFVIHVKKRKANSQRYKNFDHGFVDINRYGLASLQYAKEQQVLFNALNVYQVKKIQQKDDYKYIHLQYGVIFELLQKPKQKLTQDQYDTLINYHYCTKILGKIQDQGDVFLFANQLIQAKQYYDKKIKQGNNLAHNYYKLANVQKQCGQIDEAEKNANQALKLFGNQIDLNDRQKCLKVFGIHSKNAQINLQKQDYLTADQQIDHALSMLSDDQLFERGVKLRERGQIKFKKGQIKNAEQDFQNSEQIFQSLKDHGRSRKVAAYRNYYLSHLSLFCSQKSRGDLKKQLKQQLHKIQQLEDKISQMGQNIDDQLIKINRSLKDVSLYVQDRQKYEIYVKKAQSYLFSLKARKANDPQIKAKLLSMQAMINDYQELAESQKLMNEAIRLIQSKNPFDLKVADYSKILAKMQKSQLQKYTNPAKKLINQKPQIPIPYDGIKRKQIYQRCKTNFTKTLNVLLYHAKDKASPEILDIRNQLGELTFGENDYAQCQKIIKEARQGNQKIIHSQMAKTMLIMARICFARGQLKNAFQTLKQAHNILEEAMVNKHQKQNQKVIQKYRSIFYNNDTYLNIQFIKINIFHKQQNHDLALKSIDQINTIIVKKVGSNDSHPLLADLLQAKGCSQVFKGNIYGFDEYFERAIQLRQKQFGHYHPVNAKSYCMYAKYLIMVKDNKRAQQMLQKAVEIISAFEQSNPHYWAIYYSQGYYNEDHQQYDKSQVFYQKSLQWASKYYNKSHIAIKQVMLRYANSLNKSRKIQQSIRVYEKLQDQLDEGIRQSNKRYEVNEQLDDQKISLKKLMYSQLCDLQAEQHNKNEAYLQTSQNQLINTSLYKSKLNLLRNTYKIHQTTRMKKLSQSND